MTAPGWYQAEGDPPGTTRYWDGVQWVGDPVATPAVSAAGSQPAGAYVDTALGAATSNLASPGARIGARVIDVLVLFVIGLILLGGSFVDLINNFGDLGPDPSDAQVEAILSDFAEDIAGPLLALGAISLIWDIAWVGAMGATPGKLMLGLRVANANTGAVAPGWGAAVKRGLNRVIGLIPGFGGLISLLIGLVSLVFLFSDDQHRTVMDRIGGTLVVKK